MPPVLSYAFRPFFLGLAVVAIVDMALWIAALTGLASSPAVYGPLWHGHEMLFGFGLAAVAGFVLTAVATWTGRPPVSGPLLALLVTAWLAGRFVYAIALPPGYASTAVALTFPFLLTVIVAREIVLGGSRRNYPIIAVVALLAALDTTYHLGRLGLLAGGERIALHAAVYVLTTLVSLIAGRIVPSFTANWLRTRGISRFPRHTVLVERLTMPATVAAGGLAVILPGHPLTGAAAAAAAVLHAARLARWRGLATVAEPLVFVLHIAYAWLPAGFALLALSCYTRGVPPGSALHAFGAGVIGTTILAVTTRVALGHTGRPLRAAPVTVIAYLVLNAAVIARVSALTSGRFLTMIELAAVGWIAAWLLFLWVYTPILLSPRK